MPIAPQLFTNRVGMCSWRWKLIIVLFHRWTRAVALKSADTQYPQRSSSGTATRAGGVYFFSLSLSLSPADQSRRIVNGFSSRTQPGTIEPGTHVPGAMESVTNPINEGKGAGAPSASAKVTLTLGDSQHGAQKQGPALTTAHGARESGKLSKVS